MFYSSVTIFFFDIRKNPTFQLKARDKKTCTGKNTFSKANFGRKGVRFTSSNIPLEV